MPFSSAFHALRLATSVALLVVIGGSCAVDASFVAPVQEAGEVREFGLIQGHVAIGDAQSADGPFVVVLRRDGAFGTSTPMEEKNVTRFADRFEPELLLVPQGQDVFFQNADEVSHGFFSSSPDNGFDLGVLYPETSRATSFREPGLVRIYCSLHTGEKTQVFIAPGPYFVQVSFEQPDFAFDGLNPGSYEVEAWQGNLRMSSMRVDLDPNAEVALELELGAPLSEKPSDSERVVE